MIAFIFYVPAAILALCVIGAIGDGLAILTGRVHPWDFT